MSRDFDSLTDIVGAAGRIAAYIQAMEETDFLADAKTQDAVYVVWKLSVRRQNDYRQS